jgi:polysaccharide biosynthesis protein PslG
MASSAPDASPFSAAPLVAAGPLLASAPASASAEASAKKTTSAKGSASTPAGSGSSSAVTGGGGGPQVQSGSTGATVYGFSAPELLGWSTSEQVQQLEAMKAAGATTVRLDASWYNTQQGGQDSFNWTPLDDVMSSIQEAGLTADLIIDGTPPWAAVSSAKGSMFAQPASSAEFGDWAAAVAKRYGGKGAKYFEIWNEPNNPAFWLPAPNPAAYTADLKAAYAAIKAVDPSAVVLTGGLAPEANSSNSYDIVTFFADMYADGAQGSFDGVGDHPYTYPFTPASQTLGSAWSEMSQTSPSLRSLMAANGDSAKKIWITEYGAPTGSGGVTEAQQSDELTQAIDFAKQTSWIGSFYIYSWEDGGSDTFGVLDDTGAQKPAYAAAAAAMP